MQISLQPHNSQSLVNFAKNILSLCSEQKFANVVEANVLFKKLKKDLKAYQERVRLPTFSGKGKELQKLNQDRYQCYMALKQQLMGLSKAVGIESATTAQKLLALYPKQKKTKSYLTYAERSELIDETIKALGQANLASSLTKAGVSATFEQLKALQSQFNKLYLEQNNSNADLRRLEKPHLLRKKLEKSLQDFYQYVELMQAEADWSGLYPPLKQLYFSLQHSKHLPHKEEHSEEVEDTEKEPPKEVISTTTENPDKKPEKPEAEGNELINSAT